MNTLKQKHLLEPFLVLEAKEFVLIRPSDGQDYFDELLSEAKNIINETNIYFICKKPRLRFIESSVLYDAHNLEIGFELITQTAIKRETGILENYHIFFPYATEFLIHPERKSKLIVKYPNNSSVTYPIESIFNIFDLTCNFQSFLDSEVIDYEVLYIGQSIGQQTPSNAYQRILSHEKLQEILSDIIENEPYNEILVLLATLRNPSLGGIADARFSHSKVNNNIEAITNLMSRDNLSKKEIVSIAESCLIKYFCPTYNKLLKNPITSRTEKFLAKCRKYDINSVSVIIDTTFVCGSLYSSQCEAQGLHHTKCQLHLEGDRMNLKNILEGGV